jgi:hypothetical protein
MGDGGTLAWGLGFPWMAKNGLYPPNVPFVTHSPYVMEALLRIAEARPREAEACMRMFDGTWRFLESLRLTVAAEGAIAASYSPRVEPRLVVNASSYAAWAYGMHASFGSPSRRDRAEYMATALCRWVVSQQQDDGTWFYFADRQPGNFMDVFHTCFVIRNLRKAAQHVSALRDIVSAPAAAGWKALKEQAYDADAGLVHRYLHRDFMDPYAWDLYDQAEYLGLLVDFGEIDAAAALQRNVTGHFSRGDDWWCRLDCFGRRWGKNFLRWGIVPFWYQSARLRDAARAAHARAA